jgi:class 3 adenylate cyclase
MPPVRIFVSYSHRDTEYLGKDSLVGYLTGLTAELDAEIWTDEQIPAGAAWDAEIRSRLLTSDVAVILVSQSFLDSSYCTSVEMRTFLERRTSDGMELLPVLLSACEWERFEWLASGTPLPSRDETLEEHYREPGRRKRLYLRIRSQLREAIARARERQASTAALAPAPAAATVERRQITAVRCDLVLAQADGRPVADDDLPEILHDLVPEFLRVARPVFESQDGHVAQGTGSGMLVLFGYPDSHEYESRSAVRAGRDVVEIVRKLSARVEAEVGIRLGVRVGVHTGFVVTGVAGQDAAEMLADDATMKTASCLAEIAETDTVLLSETTHRLVDRFVETASPRRVDLPGSMGAVRAYAILGDRGRADERNRAAIPLIGRQQQLDLMLQRWTDARNSSGQIVLLRGDAGAGKSRLVSEMKQHVSAESAAWIDWTCLHHQQDTAFHPVIAWLEGWLDVRAGYDAAAILKQIRGAFAGFGARATEAAAAVAGLLSAATPDPEQKELLLGVLAELVIEHAADPPLTLAIEDLQWADPATTELLDVLIEQVPGAPILLLATMRLDEAPPHGVSAASITQLTLNRLDPNETRQMVLAITGGKTLPAEVDEEIFAKTEGIPLFIEDVTRTVIESDLLVAGENGYELVGPFQSLAIPPALQESLLARLARLATAKPIAQIGATIGREFIFEVLQAVSGFDDKLLLEELDRLVSAGVLYRRGLLSKAKYVFKHALVQEALQQSLIKKQRRQYHKTIAEVLEAKFPEVADQQPELVAYHYMEAGDPVKAAELWERAARQGVP